MPLLFWATWPHIFLKAMVAIVGAAPYAPFEILRNIATGEYPPPF